jgi:hypothetical protein
MTVVDEALSQFSVFQWDRRYKSDRELWKGDHRSGLQSTLLFDIKINAAGALVHSG